MQRYSKHEMTHPINQGIKQQASAKFHPIVCCYGLNFSLENHFVWLVKYDFKAWFNIIKHKYVKEIHFCVIFLTKKFVLSMIIRIFAATESATLPIWTANQGGSFAFMGTLRLYTKQALSISEQIELLKSRGLNIADSSKAAKFLGEVSYFRFVQYLRPMEADKTTHQFKPNSKFEDAVALYNFDIKLRDLMFKAVQRLEIALRTKIIQEFSLAHGPFWFFDTSLADDEHKFIENMNSIDRELQRSKEDFIKEHRRNYR